MEISVDIQVACEVVATLDTETGHVVYDVVQVTDDYYIPGAEDYALFSDGLLHENASDDVFREGWLSRSEVADRWGDHVVMDAEMLVVQRLGRPNDGAVLDLIAALCQTPEWESVDMMIQVQEWVRLTGRVVDTPADQVVL